MIAHFEIKLWRIKRKMPKKENKEFLILMFQKRNRAELGEWAKTRWMANRKTVYSNSCVGRNCDKYQMEKYGRKWRNEINERLSCQKFKMVWGHWEGTKKKCWSGSNYQIEKATNKFSHNNTSSFKNCCLQSISHFDIIDIISQTVWWIKQEWRSRANLSLSPDSESESDMGRILKFLSFFVHFVFHKDWAKKWVKTICFKVHKFGASFELWDQFFAFCKFMREQFASYFGTVVKIYETKTYL